MTIALYLEMATLLLSTHKHPSSQILTGHCQMGSMEYHEVQHLAPSTGEPCVRTKIIYHNCNFEVVPIALLSAMARGSVLRKKKFGFQFLSFIYLLCLFYTDAKQERNEKLSSLTGMPGVLQKWQSFDIMIRQ